MPKPCFTCQLNFGFHLLAFCLFTKLRFTHQLGFGLRLLPLCLFDISTFLPVFPTTNSEWGQHVVGDLETLNATTSFSREQAPGNQSVKDVVGLRYALARKLGNRVLPCDRIAVASHRNHPVFDIFTHHFTLCVWKSGKTVVVEPLQNISSLRLDEFVRDFLLWRLCFKPGG